MFLVVDPGPGRRPGRGNRPGFRPRRVAHRHREAYLVEERGDIVRGRASNPTADHTEEFDVVALVVALVVRFVAIVAVGVVSQSPAETERTTRGGGPRDEVSPGVGEESPRAAKPSKLRATLDVRVRGGGAKDARDRARARAFLVPPPARPRLEREDEPRSNQSPKRRMVARGVEPRDDPRRRRLLGSV